MTLFKLVLICTFSHSINGADKPQNLEEGSVRGHVISHSSGEASTSKPMYLITAATSGIGKAVCDVLASKGYSLVLTGRNESKLNELREELVRKYQGNYSFKLFDYDSLESIRNLAASLTNSIDGLVIIPKRPSMPPKEIPSAEVWTTNVFQCFITPMEFIRVCYPHLNIGSSVVVISGISSKCFVPAYANANVIRMMWTGEVKNLSIQLADKRIRVNAVSPGVILTDYSIARIRDRASASGLTYEDQLKAEAADTPSGSLGAPLDVANFVKFLLSDDSKHINGTNTALDGGLNTSY